MRVSLLYYPVTVLSRIKCKISSFILELWGDNIIGTTDKLGWEWTSVWAVDSCWKKYFIFFSRKNSKYFFFLERNALKKDLMWIRRVIEMWDQVQANDFREPPCALSLGRYFCFLAILCITYIFNVRPQDIQSYITELI